MSIINQLVNEIELYATHQCKIEIVDFATEGSGVNVNEIFKFKVRVTNEGDLGMTAIRLLISGSEYALVGSGATSLKKHFSLDHDTLRPGGKFTSNFLYGKATKVTPGIEEIVTARIDSWQLMPLATSFSHHCQAGATEGQIITSVGK